MLISSGGGVPVRAAGPGRSVVPVDGAVPSATGASPTGGFFDDDEDEDDEQEEERLLSAREGGGGADPAAICRELLELVMDDGAAAALPRSPCPSRVPESDAALSAADGSPLDFIGSRRRPVAADARVRPPLRVRVSAEPYSAHPRVHSVLSRGLKVRVPSAVPPVWRPTRRSPLMTRAIEDFVEAGVLAPGRPRACYPLFAVPKTTSVARLVYDLSHLTPHMPRRPCALPSVEKALQAAAEGYRFAVKIDLRDGYYHVPLAVSTREQFGVMYNKTTYVFCKLPMGLSIAANEMQWFACATVKVVCERFPGVIGLAYLDDFLFLSRSSSDLGGIADFLSSIGFNINFEKSILRPVSRLVYLGVDIDFASACTLVPHDTLSLLRSAIAACDESRPLLWRQRLAGYVNFIRPCLKLPLELVRAVGDGDGASCATSLPFLVDSAPLTAADVTSWRDVHERSVFVDATPYCIGIVQQGCAPVSVPLPVTLPIYLAEYLAALTAILSRDVSQTTLYSDNLGVVFNLRKGRCPRQWLSVLFSIFKSRSFSVRYVPSRVNPADAASRPFSPTP